MYICIHKKICVCIYKHKKYIHTHTKYLKEARRARLFELTYQLCSIEKINLKKTGKNKPF